MADGALPNATATTELIGGHRLRVLRSGSDTAGHPLLLLNGLGASLELLDPLRAQLGDRPVVAFDVPGVGGSPPPLYPYTMTAHARVVARLVEALGYERVDLLGLSWGGALAQEVAYRHPAKVRRLVLAATMFGIGSLPGQPDAVSILLTPLRYYSPEYFYRIAPTLYGGAIRSNPQLLRRHSHLRMTRPPHPVGYAWQLAAVSSWSSLGFLHRIKAPTLILTGDDDPIIPAANSRTMASRIPQASIEVIDGGGHLFLAARAGEVAPIIARFLDQPTAGDAPVELTAPLAAR